MRLEIAALLALVAVLAAVTVVLALAVRRGRRPPPAGTDPIVLLQQQLSGITDQIARQAEAIARQGEHVPKEVATQFAALMGQLGARLSETSLAQQQAFADTGSLIAGVRQSLGELKQSSQQILDLGKDIRELQQIFQAPKIRGGLGELGLEALLQQFLSTGQYSFQHTFGGGDMVDAVIRLPGGLVPVDSKFPLANFRAVAEATDPEQRRRARRAFCRDVRKHIDDIAEKYIRPSEGTLDCALMYIPAENVFYEVIARDDGAAEDEDVNTYALRRRVVPVSPNSMHSYLQAIAFGLRGLKVEQQAQEILRTLQQLQGDLGQFQDQFLLGQKHLKNAQAAFTDAGDKAGRVVSQVAQIARAEESAAQVLPMPAARSLPR